MVGQDRLRQMCREASRERGVAVAGSSISRDRHCWCARAALPRLLAVDTSEEDHAVLARQTDVNHQHIARLTFQRGYGRGSTINRIYRRAMTRQDRREQLACRRIVFHDERVQPGELVGSVWG